MVVIIGLYNKFISLYVYIVVCGDMQIKIDKELEKEFRLKAGAIFGAKKGALALALTQAIQSWLKNQGNKKNGSEL